jgi:hypothetical protein
MKIADPYGTQPKRPACLAGRVCLLSREGLETKARLSAHADVFEPHRPTVVAVKPLFAVGKSAGFAATAFR